MASTPPRSCWGRGAAAGRRLWLRPGRGRRRGRASGDIDVSIWSTERAVPRPPARPRRTAAERGPAGSRRRWGWALGRWLGPVALVGLLALAGDRQPAAVAPCCCSSSRSTVAVALVGGLGPALACAVVGSLLVNCFFTPPLHTLHDRRAENAFALVIFVVVAAAVATVVGPGSPANREAARGAGRGGDALDAGGQRAARRGRLRRAARAAAQTFAMTSAALLEHEGDRLGLAAGRRRRRSRRTPSPARPTSSWWSADDLAGADDRPTRRRRRPPGDGGVRRLARRRAASASG